VTLLVQKIASLAYLAALLGLSLGMCESAYLRKKKLGYKSVCAVLAISHNLLWVSEIPVKINLSSLAPSLFSL
jgi:hypothetical protein